MSYRPISQVSVTPGPGASLTEFNRSKFRVRPGYRLASLVFKLLPTFVSTDAAAYMLSAADLLAAYQAALGNLRAWFGESVELMLDKNIPLNTLRRMGLAATLRDFQVQPQEGAVETALNGATGLLTVPALGSLSPILWARRTFTVERQGRRIDEFCPGKSQGDQLFVAIQPSAAAYSADAGKVTLQGGAMEVVLGFEEVPGSDRWVEPYRTSQVKIVDYAAKLPAEGHAQAILSAYLTANPLASTEARDILVSIGGREIQPIADARDIGTSIAERDPLGTYDLTQLVTPIYAPEDHADIDSYAAGDGLVIENPNGELVNNDTLEAVYVPSPTRSHLQQVGENLLLRHPDVELTSDAPLSGRPLSLARGGFGPMAVLTPASYHGARLPALGFARGRPMEVKIPHPVIAVATAEATAHKGGATSAPGAAAMADGIKRVAAAIPGTVRIGAPGGGLVSPEVLHVADRVLSSGVETQAQAATAKANIQGVLQRALASWGI